jgi:hypothetical protein
MEVEARRSLPDLETLAVLRGLDFEFQFAGAEIRQSRIDLQTPYLISASFMVLRMLPGLSCRGRLLPIASRVAQAVPSPPLP